MKIALVFRRL